MLDLCLKLESFLPYHHQSSTNLQNLALEAEGPSSPNATLASPGDRWLPRNGTVFLAASSGLSYLGLGIGMILGLGPFGVLNDEMLKESAGDGVT